MKWIIAFADANALARALRRAEKAHAEYEKGLGKRDENWADWYAHYLTTESLGIDDPDAKGQYNV